jgi:hypothetical protein
LLLLKNGATQEAGSKRKDNRREKLVVVVVPVGIVPPFFFFVLVLMLKFIKPIWTHRYSIRVGIIMPLGSFFSSLFLARISANYRSLPRESADQHPIQMIGTLSLSITPSAASSISGCYISADPINLKQLFSFVFFLIVIFFFFCGGEAL